jgi:hypothetical protein
MIFYTLKRRAAAPPPWLVVPKARLRRDALAAGRIRGLGPLKGPQVRECG